MGLCGAPGLMADTPLGDTLFVKIKYQRAPYQTVLQGRSIYLSRRLYLPTAVPDGAKDCFAYCAVDLSFRRPAQCCSSN